MEYKILEYEVPSKLVEAVNRHLKEGWRLAGGLCCTSDCYAQAMTLGETP
jgi:hypothetical protein